MAWAPVACVGSSDEEPFKVGASDTEEESDAKGLPLSQGHSPPQHHRALLVVLGAGLVGLAIVCIVGVFDAGLLSAALRPGGGGRSTQSTMISVSPDEVAVQANYAEDPIYAEDSFPGEDSLPGAQQDPYGDPASQGAASVENPFSSSEVSQACLCVFDVDRTLTGKQGAGPDQCPGNREVAGVFDPAYGGGTLHLSPLGQSVGSTFCSKCKLGIVSAGSAGEEDERSELLKQIGGSARTAGERAWSGPHPVTSPLVFGCPDPEKADAVQGIVDWYYQNAGVTILQNEVFFFDDHTGNTQGFAEKGFNARQVSCQSREGIIGHCGATPEEIVRELGVFDC